MDLGGDDRETIPPRFETHADRLSYLLAEYKIPLTLAALAGIALVASGRAGIPEPPRWAILTLQGFALGIIPAFFLGKTAIVDKFMPDTAVRVVELDPRDGTLADVHLVPPAVWEARRRGEHSALRVQRGAVDWIVTSFEWLDDVETLRIEGANPELADPAEIVARDGKLQEIYENLQEQAERATRLEATMSSKRLRIEQANANALLAAVEHGTSFNPGSAAEIIGGDEWDDLMGDAEDERTDEHDQTLSEMLDEREQSAEPTADSRAQTPPVEAATDGGRDP